MDNYHGLVGSTALWSPMILGARRRPSTDLASATICGIG
jgi:hypothetical protein